MDGVLSNTAEFVPFDDDDLGVLPAESTEDRLATAEQSLVARVDALEITSAEQARTAVDLLDAIADLRRELAEHHDPIIQAAYKAHKAALQAKAKLDDPLKQAEAKLRRLLGAWEQAERERVEAERRKEQERLASLARAAEEAGDAEKAAALQMATAATPEREPVVSSTAKYEVEVTDLAALVQAVAKGAVPLDALEANLSAIRKAAASAEGKLEWPGVKVTVTRSVRRSRTK